LLAAALGACAPTPDPGARNLLLITLDTTRRDHLSLYGYERDTTPNLVALGEKSAVFDNGFAQGTTTNPAHASIFTGLYPHVHGVGTNVRALSDETVTLAEVLGASGFRTGGFVSGFTMRIRKVGVHQGFEHWDQKFGKMRRDGDLTTDAALEWLAGIPPDERFFLFVHLYDVHGPYHPKEGYLGRFRSPTPGRRVRPPKYQRVKDADGEVILHLNPLIDRYDDLNRYQDDLVAKVMAAVDPETTLVVILGDHGETMDERGGGHNLTHGSGVFDEQIRIPYLISGPGVVPGRYAEPVEQVDVMPTVLDLLGIDVPTFEVYQGESLAPLVRGERPPRRDGVVFSNSRCNQRYYASKGYDLQPRGRIHTVRSLGWKLVAYPGVETDYYELYDLEADAGETTDVASQHPETVLQMSRTLDEWLAARAPQSAQELDLSPDEEEKMRALGYLN
jgi:arylsulfatase A-like enzyme